MTTNPNVVEVEKMFVVYVLQIGHSGNGCDLASTLCKYDLRRMIYLFSWARVRQVRWRSIFRAANV